MRVATVFRRPVMLIGLIGLAALLALAFWPTAEPVDLAAVTRGRLVVTVDEEGETRLRHRFVVSAPVSGLLQRIDLEPGTPITRGQTIIAAIRPAAPSPLDARSAAEARAAADAADSALGAARADEARARSARALAESERARYRALAADRLVPAQALEAREADLRAAREAESAATFAAAGAEHQLRQARARLLQASGSAGAGRPITITAPIDGVVLRRLRESEGVVIAGTPLVEVGNPADIEIVSDLLSHDAVRVSPGAPVIVEHWGGDRPLEARVRTVEPSGFTKVSALGVEEQRVNVVCDFDPGSPAAARLGDGYRVDVRVVVWEGPSVLKVPGSSLFRRGDDWAAFVADNGRARERRLRVGQRNGAEAEVLSGLAEGERVVLHPSDTVRDGSRVTPR